MMSAPRACGSQFLSVLFNNIGSCGGWAGARVVSVVARGAARRAVA